MLFNVVDINFKEEKIKVRRNLSALNITSVG